MCGPNEWHLIKGFESCAEKGTQSPINMELDAADKLADQSFSFVTNGDCSGNVEYDLNAHTVEVEFKPSCKDTYHVMFQGKKYNLMQFHFHSPSENQWDGGHFAMEGHYVHKLEGADEYVVLAVMIGVHSEGTSPFLGKVLTDIPHPTSTGNAYHKTGHLDVSSPYAFVPPSISHSQYYFEGSMTTPTPSCNPGPTHWVMAKEAAYVKQSTVDAYRALINSDPDNQLSPYGTIMGVSVTTPPVFNKLSGIVTWNATQGCNNRPVQPLTGAANPTRRVYDISPVVTHVGVEPNPYMSNGATAEALALIFFGMALMITWIECVNCCKTMH